jgi:hypothetical protein
MRRSTQYTGAAIAASCAAVATMLVIQADLPARQMAGKIALAWVPLILIFALVFARKPAQEGTKS